MRTLRFMLLVVLIGTMVVVTPRSALAKGQVSKVDITGPGLKGTVEVTDPALLAGLSMGEFEQFGKALDTVPALGEGYEIARYLQEPGDKPFIFDRIHYFLALSGEAGYIYFDGLEG